MLGGRPFTIKKQFLEDIAQYENIEFSLRNKALLVLHGPLDSIVSIEEAEKIYQAAKHPKSFISLDDADHLLSRTKDAEYVATAITGWASRYLPVNKIKAQEMSVNNGQVLVEEKDHKFAQNISSDDHTWLADEPVKLGGKNTGPDPYEQLLAALGACTAMTIRMYANRKKIPVDHVAVQLQHSRCHKDDCEGVQSDDKSLEQIQRVLTLKGDLTADQIEQLTRIADRCPVHKTLTGELSVVTRLAE